MIRKTALLTGIAGAMLFAAPALAQDSMTSPQPAQDPAAAATTPAEDSATSPAQPETLTLQPGANVKASDGAVLGKLEGAQTNASGEQELTVRGTDGEVRAVPLAGLRPEGADVVVGLTAAEFQAAATVAADASAATAPAADPSATPDASATPAPTEPSDPAASSESATPDADADADAAAPAPTEPQA